MKNLFVLICMAVMSLSLSAQELSQTTIDGNEYLVVSMETETQGYDQVSILLNKGFMKKFITSMRKYAKQVDEWNQTAHEKDVKEYKKTMTGTIPLKKIFFNCDGLDCVSDKYYDNYLVPYFRSDVEGNCYFVLGGYYAGYNMNPYADATDTNESKKEYSYQHCKFPFHLSIPAEELNNWVDKLEVAAENVNVKQKDNNELSKLFK